MCGIVYSMSFIGKPVNKTIKKRYLAQRSRGTSGFGFYVPESDRLTHNPREGRIMSLLRRNKKASEILFHHRMPTSTPNVRNACHPFSTKDYFKHNYVVVHNGVLWNDSELKAAHNRLGIDYVSEQEDSSFNDSEALTYDLARYIEGEVDSITARGSIAFIVIQRDKKGRRKALYFGRNTGNPLIMKRTIKSLTLSSEGDGVLIDPDVMYRFDYKTREVTREKCVFPTSGFSSYEYRKDGYPYYLDNDDDEELWIDDNGKLIRDPYGYTKSFFTAEEQQERNKMLKEKDRLMIETAFVPDRAIELGEWEIKVMEEEVARLKVKVRANIATDEETSTYYKYDDAVYYITQAVDRLKQEAVGASQTSFRYSVDSPGTSFARKGVTT